MNVKLLLSILLMLVLIPLSLAAQIGIIVEFPDKSVETQCVEVDEGDDGKEVLDKSSFDLLWSPESDFGQLICKIDGEGTDIKDNFCAYFGSFWNFNILENGKWLHSPVGHNGPGGCWDRDENSFNGHYCAQEGDVIGYAFGSGAEPPAMSFDEICNKKAASLRDVDIFVDGDLDQGSTIEANPGSLIDIRITLENLLEDESIEGDIEVVLEDILNGRDLDESRDFRINANRDERISIDLRIPKDAVIDEYDLSVSIESDDSDPSFSFDIDYEVEIEERKGANTLETNTSDQNQSITKPKSLSTKKIKAMANQLSLPQNATQEIIIIEDDSLDSISLIAIRQMLLLALLVLILAFVLMY